MSVKIGIIGGSGLENMGIIENIEHVTVETPYGNPSDNLTLGTIKGKDIVFLARHGRHHTIPPHMVNYRANIFALKECGVEYLLSTAAVGSLRKEIQPGDLVIADQIVDWTKKRDSTFFDEGVTVHVGFADPFCSVLSDIIKIQAKNIGLTTHAGTYICMEGPQFSTRAESKLYRQWDIDVIGMTLAPEAKLAREAEMCVGCILAVTDYDCWIDEEESVCVSSIVEILKQNNEAVAKLLQHIVPKITYDRTCDCSHALNHALITPHDLIKKGNLAVNRVLLKRFMK